MALATPSIHNLLAEQSRKNKFQTFRYVALFFFIFLVTPVLFTFVNALRRDPAVPQLARAAFDEARRRSVSFLGRQDPAETLSATVPGDDGVASTAPPADASLRQRAPQAGAPLT